MAVPIRVERSYSPAANQAIVSWASVISGSTTSGVRVDLKPGLDLTVAQARLLAQLFNQAADSAEQLGAQIGQL